VQLVHQVIFKLADNKKETSAKQVHAVELSIPKNLRWPVAGRKVITHFGKYTLPSTSLTSTSDGINITTEGAVPVFASAKGTVSAIFNDGGINGLFIRHDGF